MMGTRSVAALLAALVAFAGCSDITTPVDPAEDAVEGPSEAELTTVAGDHRLEIELLGALLLNTSGPYEALPNVSVALLEIVPIPPEEQVTDSTGVRAKVEFVPRGGGMTGADGVVAFDVAPGEYGVELETRCHGTAYLYVPTTDGESTRYEVRLPRRWQPGGLVPEGC